MYLMLKIEGFSSITRRRMRPKQISIICCKFRQMSEILISPRQGVLLLLIQCRGADILLAQLRAALLLAAMLFLTLADGTVSIAAAQSTPPDISDRSEEHTSELQSPC